jgi:hypothetical protein
MPLAECRECRQQASSFAVACPHCGAPDPVRRNRAVSGFEGVTVLLLLALLLSVTVGPFAADLLLGPPRWACGIDFVRDDAAAEQLRNIGQSGWEIVSARRASTDAASGTGAWGYELILRRSAD